MIVVGQVLVNGVHVLELRIQLLELFFIQHQGRNGSLPSVLGPVKGLLPRFYGPSFAPAHRNYLFRLKLSLGGELPNRDFPPDVIPALGFQFLRYVVLRPRRVAHKNDPADKFWPARVFFVIEGILGVAKPSPGHAEIIQRITQLRAGTVECQFIPHGAILRLRRQRWKAVGHGLEGRGFLARSGRGVLESARDLLIGFQEVDHILREPAA